MDFRGLRTAALAVGSMVAALALASPSQAAKFAEFSQVAPAAPNVAWTNSGAGNSGASGSFVSTTAGLGSTSPLVVPIQFSFLEAPLASVQNVQASFYLNSNVTNVPALNLSGVLVQGGLTGNFQIKYTGAADIVIGLTHYSTGANLLSGWFNNGVIVGTGTVGSTLVTTVSGNVLNFTSDFKSFANSVSRDFVLNLNAINPVLGANAGKALKSFTANADGAFGNAVPEPSTWAVMILGIGMIGIAYRRRRALGRA